MIVKATEIKNSFGKYLKLLDEEDIIIVKNGTPVARMTSYECWDEADKIMEGMAAYSFGKKRMSYEEFMEMYENTEERLEYIDGEVYLLSSPKVTHQKVLGNLHVIFRLWFKGKKCIPYLSPFDVMLKKGEGNDNVVQPDLLVVCDPENKNEKDKYTGVPSLVVEILSESTIRKDLIKKLDLYMHSGVEEYWVVNYFNREVTVYKFVDKNYAEMKTFVRDDTVESFIFKGFTADLKDIFE